jgi:Cu-Zn family superoxide dismutase
MRCRALTVIAAVIGTTAVGSSAAAEGPSYGDLRVTAATATARPYQPGAGAVTYDQSLVASGARLTVFGLSTKRAATVLLTTHGLLPRHEYGAHVHVRACGSTPADSGPHFQDKNDPIQPSVDPAYANPHNEIWLDFTTDQAGNGAAVAHVPWGFGERRAGSVVVHATHTHTDPGHAGTAGARLACLNAKF